MAYSLILCLLLATVAGAQRARHGGRYDRQILENIQKIIASKYDFKDIRADVEDGIVSLHGAVRLASSRRWLEHRVIRVAHVGGVRNEIVLDPPALPDNEVAARVQRNLSDAGFGSLQFTVNSGEVALSGVVRNQKEQRRVLQVVRATPGVKETESKISIVEDF
jgi:osmotically-inducible protein OsmY